jgi:hypothetical protein
MMIRSSALTALGTRRLSPVQWNRAGCRLFYVSACADVSPFDDGMIRRALLRGSLVCQKVDELSHAINRQLWEIGYVARVRFDQVDRTVEVEVSKPR